MNRIIISNSVSIPHYICQSILFENQIWAAIIDTMWGSVFLKKQEITLKVEQQGCIQDS